MLIILRKVVSDYLYNDNENGIQVCGILQGMGSSFLDVQKLEYCKVVRSGVKIIWCRIYRGFGFEMWVGVGICVCNIGGYKVNICQVIDFEVGIGDVVRIFDIFLDFRLVVQIEGRL